MLQYTMLRRTQTLQRDRSKRHATAVAGSRPTGAIHRNTARHPSGGPSGAERGSREPGGAIRTGIIAAAIIFHQETSDVSPDLMVDAEGTRRYLRPCGFTEAQIDEIIADARADQPSSSTVVTPARTSARNVREHVVTPLIIPTPKDLFKMSPQRDGQHIRRGRGRRFSPSRRPSPGGGRGGAKVGAEDGRRR